MKTWVCWMRPAVQHSGSHCKLKVWEKYILKVQMLVEIFQRRLTSSNIHINIDVDILSIVCNKL